MIKYYPNIKTLLICIVLLGLSLSCNVVDQFVTSQSEAEQDSDSFPLEMPSKNEQADEISADQELGEEAADEANIQLVEEPTADEADREEPIVEAPADEEPAEPATLASIPEAPLSQKGPWTVFLAKDGIWALNQDGSGLTHLVDEIVVAPSELSAGINGSYLAFMTASDAFTLQDLTLKMLKLPEGTVETITPIIAPENEPGDSPEICDPKHEAARAVTIYNGLAWSPNGTKLAFIGAMDGPTADLYVYTPEDGSITRLTDGPSQAYSVNWSRSGEHIVHFGVSCFGTGAGFNMTGAWASNAETGDAITLYQPSEESWGEEFVANYWGAEDAFYVATTSGCPVRDLRLVDLQTQEVTMVHEGCFWDYSVYPPEIIAVLNGSDFSDEPGLYLYSPEAPFPLLNYIPFENGQELGRYENMFLIKSIDYDKPLPEISSVNIAVGSPGWYQGQGDFPLRWPGMESSYTWLERNNFYYLPEGTDQPKLLSDQGARYPYWMEELSDTVGDYRMHLLYFVGDESATLYIASEPDFIPIPIADGLMPKGEFARMWSSD